MSALSPQTQRFVEMLNEPVNTLGRTEEAVTMVLQDPALIDYLYHCYFQPDVWVRLRVSSSFKRLWRADEGLVKPYIGGFVDDVSVISQPSVNWTFAQLCRELDHLLTPAQRTTAVARLKGYLEQSDDWIVQKSTIDTLADWAATNNVLSTWLQPRLEELAESPRRSVAKKAAKRLDQLR